MKTISIEKLEENFKEKSHKTKQKKKKEERKFLKNGRNIRR